MILSLLRIKPMFAGIDRPQSMLINLHSHHIALMQPHWCSPYGWSCSPRSQHGHFRQSHLCGYTHMGMHERAVFEQHDNQKSGATRALWFMSWPPKNVYVFLGKPQSHYISAPFARGRVDGREIMFNCERFYANTMNRYQDNVHLQFLLHGLVLSKL